MRVKQEFKICSLSIFSQGLYWNAFRSVTSKEQGRRHFGNCQYSILKSEDPEIESRLRLLSSKGTSDADNTRSSAPPSSGSVLKLSALVIHDHHTYTSSLH